jgi:hypothetical protein
MIGRAQEGLFEGIRMCDSTLGWTGHAWDWAVLDLWLDSGSTAINSRGAHQLRQGNPENFKKIAEQPRGSLTWV